MDQLKLFVEQNREKVMWGVCAVLVVVAYVLGFMHARGKDNGNVAIEESQSPSMSQSVSPSVSTVASDQKGPFLASKKGSYYYPPDCEAKSILGVATLITFNTVADAEAKGYTLSPRCAK